MVSRFFNHPQFMLENSAYTSVFWAIFLSYNCYYEKFSDGSVKNIQDEIPFDLPAGWAWSRLKSIVIKEIKRGKAPIYADKSSVLVFAQKCNVKHCGINMQLAKYLNEAVLKKYTAEDFLFIDDVIINSTGTGTLGRVGILSKECFYPVAKIVPDTHITVVRTHKEIVSSYIFFMLKHMQPKLEISGEGSTNQKELRPDYIKNLLCPIPPIGEQLKIVDVITESNEALKVIDTKEFEISDVIASLKSKILELAIQGKLVPQNENDEPASVLLERIRAERKANLGKKYVESYIFKGDDNCYYEKVGNTSKKISEEMPFDLPFGWCWITLKEIATITSGKTPKNEQITDLGNIPYFKVGDMNLSGNEIFMEVVQYYVNDCYTGITFPKNSFIFPKNGGALLTNKKRILKQESLVDLNTGVLIPSSAVNNEFMFYLFSTVDFTKNYKGSTIPTIDNEMIGNIIFALPPIEEQSRIVQKIKAIMSILKGGD